MSRRRTIHLGPSLILGIALLGAAGTALAQRVDTAAADALFDEGKQLSAEGRFAEACARFEASVALVAQLGVQLNLGDCYERLGKTASAWLAFGEATALARRLGDHPRWRFALERQAALRARLSRIVINVARGAVADLAVTRDGVQVPAGTYGVEVPVDPGDHAIAATAPDRVAWSTRVTVSPDAAVVTVAIPELARAPAPAAMPARVADEGTGRMSPRAAWIAGGIGVVGTGLGAYFGVAARSLWLRAKPGCDRTNACGDAAFSAGERSRRDGAISTGAFAVGGAALVTGVVLYLRAPRARAPRARAPRARAAPAISSDAVGVAVVGGF